MDIKLLKENIKGVDIYLLDQILKNRYQPGDKILDAGCGNGRNLKWFYKLDCKIFGLDISSDDIEYCKEIYTHQRENFIKASIERIPFEENSFDHVICNAVLHFAKDLSQYLEMFKELLRIVRPDGSLFIRTASNFGLESKFELLEDGIYKLPDGSIRFLLTEELLKQLKEQHNISFLEIVKTTIVENKRCMTTLVLKKR